MSAPTHYFVTDIECDGPDPARNSMLSLATVVVGVDSVGDVGLVVSPGEVVVSVGLVVGVVVVAGSLGLRT